MSRNMTFGRDKMNHVKISLPLIDFYTIILIQLNRMVHEIPFVILRHLAKDVCVSLSPIFCSSFPGSSLYYPREELGIEVNFVATTRK